MVEVEGDSSYSFYVSWNRRSLHNEHCWRWRVYVILFRLCWQLDSTFRGCFPVSGTQFTQRCCLPQYSIGSLPWRRRAYVSVSPGFRT